MIHVLRSEYVTKNVWNIVVYDDITQTVQTIKATESTESTTLRYTV